VVVGPTTGGAGGSTKGGRWLFRRARCGGDRSQVRAAVNPPDGGRARRRGGLAPGYCLIGLDDLRGLPRIRAGRTMGSFFTRCRACRRASRCMSANTTIQIAGGRRSGRSAGGPTVRTRWNRGVLDESRGSRVIRDRLRACGRKSSHKHYAAARPDTGVRPSSRRHGGPSPAPGEHRCGRRRYRSHVEADQIVTDQGHRKGGWR